MRVVMLDPVGGICDVELDRPAATCLEVDSAQAARGLQEVAGMRFAVQQLLVRTAVEDRSPDTA